MSEEKSGIKQLDMKLVIVPFGSGFRCATKVGGRTLYGDKAGSEAEAVMALFRGLSGGQLAAEVSLALDLAFMETSVQKLLGDGV